MTQSTTASVGHTPGPWHVPAAYSDFQIHGPDGKRVADVLTLERHAAECEANARLIAGAPDLLRACQKLIELFDYYRNQGLFGESTAYNPHMSGHFQFAKQAIAKAEGRDS